MAVERGIVDPGRCGEREPDRVAVVTGFAVAARAWTC
jgi:hypothetical protein